MKKILNFMTVLLVGTLLFACQPETSSSSSVSSSPISSESSSTHSSVDIPAPIITVDPIEDSIYAGQAYDMLKGVVALDITDGTLTSLIQVDQGTYDNNVPGTYTITYTVTNSGNKTAKATRTITVKEKVTAVEIDGQRFPALVNPRLNAQYTSQVFGYDLNKVTVFEKEYFEWMQVNSPERLGIYFSIVAVTNGNGTVREIRNAIGGHIKDYGLENGGITQKNATTWCPSSSAPTNEAAPYCGLYEGGQLANINDLEDGALVVVFPNGGTGYNGEANSEGSPRFFGDTTLLKDTSKVINQVKISVVDVDEKDRFNPENTRPVIKLAKNTEKVEVYIGTPAPDLLDGVTVIDNKDTHFDIQTNIYYYAGQGKFGAKVDSISTSSANIYTVEYVVTDSDNNVDKMYRQYTVRTAPDSIQIGENLFEAKFDVADFFRQCGDDGQSGSSCYNKNYATKSVIYVLDRDFVVTEKAISSQYLSKIASTFVLVVDSNGKIKTARSILGEYWLPIPETGPAAGQNQYGWYAADTAVFNRSSDMLKGIEDVSASGDLILIAPSGGAKNTAGITPRDYLAYYLFNSWSSYPTSPVSAPDGWRSGNGTINLTDITIRVNKTSATPDPVKLGAPTNLVVDAAGKLTWDKVANASKYKVTFVGTGEEFIVGTNSFDLNNALMSVGEYQVTVTAIGDSKYYLDSDASTEVAYTQVIRKLDQVKNVVVSETKEITWNKVTFASSYLVKIEYYVDGVLTSENSYDVTGLTYDASTLADGNYKVYVTAIGDGVEYENGDASAAVEFSIGLPQLAKVEGVEIADGVATWTAVSNATSYEVIAKNKVTSAVLKTEVTETTAALTFVNVVGEYDVTVAAKAAGYKTSEDSDAKFYRNLVGQNKIMVNGVVTGFDVDYRGFDNFKANWTTLASRKNIFVIEDISSEDNLALLETWTSNAPKSTVTMIVDSTGHVKLVRTIIGNYQWTPEGGWKVTDEYKSDTNHLVNMKKYISEGDILVVATNMASKVNEAAAPRDYLAYFFQAPWANFNVDSMIAISNEGWRGTITSFIDNTNTKVYFGKA